MSSDLERTFDFYWRVIDGPELTPEHRFHDTRRWRFDRAHVPSMVAIELEGGTYSGGRHTRGAGFAKDCEKYNAAQLAGWRVFRFTGAMVQDVDQLAEVKQLIEEKS